MQASPSCWNALQTSLSKWQQDSTALAPHKCPFGCSAPRITHLQGYAKHLRKCPKAQWLKNQIGSGQVRIIRGLSKDVICLIC